MVRKDWISVELSAPSCVVDRIAIWDDVSAPIWISVNASIEVVVNPLTWFQRQLGDVDRLKRVGAEPLSCVVVRPCTCAVDERADLVGREQIERRGVRLPSCVAVNALVCVVVKAWISVEVSDTDLPGREPRDLRVEERADLGFGQVVDRGRGQARDLRCRGLGHVHSVERIDGQRIELRWWSGRALGWC